MGCWGLNLGDQVSSMQDKHPTRYAIALDPEEGTVKKWPHVRQQWKRLGEGAIPGKPVVVKQSRTAGEPPSASECLSALRRVVSKC